MRWRSGSVAVALTHACGALTCASPPPPEPTPTPTRPPTETPAPTRTPDLPATAEAERRSRPATVGPTGPQSTATAAAMIAAATAFAVDLQATIVAQDTPTPPSATTAP